MKQRTLRQTVVFEGRGIHNGRPVKLVVRPGEPDAGILFARVDLDPELKVPATIDNAKDDGTRQTVLVVGEGVVRTIEHLMATFHGLGIDNALVEIDGEELPAMDGSARDFAEAFLRSGLEEQPRERKWIEIDRPLFIDQEEQSIVFLPGPHLSISYTLSYRHEDLQDQYLSIRILPEIFESELASARTFCLKEEANALLAQGLGKGANLANTLVFERNVPVENTLRFENEACRHKVMDLMGDLYLLGGFLRGHVIATRSGHMFNLEFVRKLAMSKKKENTENVSSVLSVEEIQKIIPHRYPFLFIDRIQGLSPGVRAVGYKQVSVNDYFFQGHFPEHPVMPGVLVIEAMAQVGGVIMLSKPENRGKIAYFMSIDFAKFRHPVVPGDELRMEVEVIKIRARTGQCSGRAFVGDKLVCEAAVKFAVVDR